MRMGEQQQIAAGPPGAVVAGATLDGEALGFRRDRAPEQFQQLRVAGVEALGPDEKRRVGIGAGKAQSQVDPEIGFAAAAAQDRDHGFGEAPELHHGVAVQVAPLRNQVEEMTFSLLSAPSVSARKRRSTSTFSIGHGAPVASVKEIAVA